ncbi:MAG: ATP-binding protein [Candidatus Omnitrophica bacterium]|nr:ATP-binding protein [Candidatus Omnitrophota bacterium]MCM8798058.1 ATP-binding protein [Candidatus Omnitrophota bacterium]
MVAKRMSRKEKGYLRYETVLEVTSWWGLLFISWVIKWFYAQNAELPFLYLIILSLAMAGLLIFRLLPPHLKQERRIYLWCLLFITSVLVFEHFTGGAESPFWFLYLLPLVVSTAFFSHLSSSLSLLFIIYILIILDTVLVNKEFTFPIIRTCFIKFIGLGFVSFFTHFLNREAIKIKKELIHAYDSLREKQGEIEKINTELRSQREILLQTTTELQRANEYLKKLSQIKSDFVSVVSHELRTPLTSIRESISLILDGEAGEINSEQMKFLRIAEKNVERLTNLINDILDFSKLESGGASLNPRRTNLNQVVQIVYEAMYPAIQDKSIEVKMELSPELPESWMDPEKINQVLTNMLSNALKFTPVGGTIWIRTRPLLREGKEEIEVSVRDTGPGIAQEDIPKLFTPFSQLASPLTRKSGGTGLGLAICKNIVELHGGNIGVESEVGKGSEFYFRIPVYKKNIELNFILDEEINKYKIHHVSFSLILLRIQKCEELRKSLWDKEWEVLNQRIEEVIRRTVRGPKDRISHYQEGEFLAVIAETNREGALKIVERINEAVGKDEEIKKISSLFLDAGIAVYPEEAEKKETLLSKAEEELLEKNLIKKEEK